MYVLCLLAFMACSDDDDKIITDFDKPFSNLSTDELKTILDNNLFDGEELVREARYYYYNQIAALEHYFDIEIEDLLGNDARSSDNKAFTGLKFTWNKDKKEIDKTANAAAYLECYCPFSTTDDSRNDLHVIVQRNISEETHIQLLTYKDDELTLEYDRIFIKGQKMYNSMSGGPYELFSNVEAQKNNSGEIGLLENMCKKSGERSFYYSESVENGDMVHLLECNDIRIRARIQQYKNISELREQFINKLDNESYIKFATELLSANMVDAVVVFKDRDEKIGDLVIIECNFSGAIYGCKMKDGTIHKLDIDFN